MHSIRYAGALGVTTLAALAPLTAQQASTRTIDVRVDRRVELMSIVFRLAGNPEYGQARIESYSSAVDEHFGKFADHPLIARARQLRRERGISFDAPMSLAVHLGENRRQFRLAVPLDPWPEALDSRWTAADIEAFLHDADRFARQSKLDAFLAGHSDLCALACARLRAVLDEHARLDWLDDFFGTRPGAEFTICIGLLNGGANYGPRCRDKSGDEHLYAVLGAWLVDEEGNPRFDESVVSTVIHELCHSYCNPLVDAHLDELRAGAEMLWPHVEAGMRAQAYGNWQIMMRESLVRACVARYQHAIGGERALRSELDEQKRRDFLWIEGLTDLIGDYEAKRDEYRDLGEFMPRVVEFFETCPGELEAELARAPRVASIAPHIGQQDVDPKLEAIVVTFDRPMLDGAWAVVGGGPLFPELTGKVSYDSTHTVLTIPVRLEPDHDYELWLNRGRFDSFQSADRVKLRPVHVTFRTRSAGTEQDAR
jgi:hypothetical protein